jgi:hypothetical protein
MFDVFVCDGVGSDNAGDADSAYTVLLAMNIAPRLSHCKMNLRSSEGKHENHCQLLLRLHLHAHHHGYG